MTGGFCTVYGTGAKHVVCDTINIFIVSGSGPKTGLAPVVSGTLFVKLILNSSEEMTTKKYT